MLRKDEGVVLMRGRSDGERDDPLRWEGSCWFTGGVFGKGGAPCMVDIRFIRLVSVGLIVLAPNPDACELDEGICDIRLAADDGVDVLRPLCRPGDFPAYDNDLE